jgi:hypothetical protein
MANKYNNRDQEYDDKGYRVETYGLNKPKWTPSNQWTDYEDYHNEYQDKSYQRRYFNISHSDVKNYLKYHNNLFADNVRTGNQNWQSLIENTSSNTDFRLRELLNPETGSKSYSLQYQSSTGGWREHASGYENQSGRTTSLSLLNPEYLDDLKRKGYGPIYGSSSWFDMEPEERKEYGREEWINTPFQMDLRVDKEGKTWSGWKHYGNYKSPLSYKLTHTDVRTLPQSIVNKYNLQGYENLRMSPYDGEIYIVSDSGGHLRTISQPDMKWFQNPGRISEWNKDPRVNRREDNFLDYLTNYDFEYWQDTQPINLEEKKIQLLETKNNNEINLPERQIVDINDISNNEEEIIDERQDLTPISIPSIELTELPTDDQKLTLIPPKTQNINIQSDDDSSDGTKTRVVPKPGGDDDLGDMPEIVLTPKMEEEREKSTTRTKEQILEELKNTTGDDRKALYDELGWAYDDTIPNKNNESSDSIDETNYNEKYNEESTVEEIMTDLKDVKGSTNYVNKSVNAILDAVENDDYSEKDLNRDLDLFKTTYGDENLQLLQLMLEKKQNPKGRRGLELRKFQEAGEKNPGWLAKRLAKTVNPIGYDIKNAISGLLAGERQPFMWDGVEQTFDNFGYDMQGNPIMDPDVEGRFRYGDTEEKHREHTGYIKSASMDSWLKYLGFPQENETFVKSSFVPTTRKEDVRGTQPYWSFSYDDDIWDEVLSKSVPIKGASNISIFNDKFDEFFPNGMLMSNSSSGGFTLKDYTLSKGYDAEVGLPYISYFDEFDFDIPVMGGNIAGEKIIGQPYNVYGRMYYDPERKNESGDPVRIFPDEFEDLDISLNTLKAGLMSMESSNGINMKNSDSSSTGLYGQLFEQIEDSNVYTGTRDQFEKDIFSQNEIFDKKFEGSLFQNEKGIKESANDLYYEYRDQLENMPYSKTELAALVNFLGRQGTREFLGYVLRDGESLEKVFPNLYGEDAEQKNKTPFEYVDEFREAVDEYKKAQSFESYILNNLPAEIANQFLHKYSKEELLEKQRGGELKGRSSKKWSRILSELDKYNQGESISPISKEVLLDYELIDGDSDMDEEIIVEDVKETPVQNIEKTKNKNTISVNNRKFNLTEQLSIYNKYLNGYYYDNEEKGLKKIIDKMNTVYYNNSKSKNMHVYDYIKSLQTNEYK